MRRRIASLITCAAAVAVLGGVAHAEHTVTTIPWVQANPDIPHQAVNGKTTMLQAVAEGGNCGGAYQYQWDINGDGDFADPNEQLRNASAGGLRGGYFASLGLDVQYPPAEGDRLYFPKVSVVCGGETVTSTMPVIIRVDRICTAVNQANCSGDQNLSLTRQVFSNRAVDRALWWMYNRQQHDTSGGVHRCYNPNSGYLLFNSGHVQNAFLRRGHGAGANRDQDPYYRNMTHCGLDFMLAQMSYAAVRFDDTNNAGVKGQGLFFGWSNYQYSYASTAWAEPVAQFGNPDYVSPIGPTRGRDLRHVGQDIADTMVHCLNGSGYWMYNCRQNGIDGSTNGWPSEALRLLHRKLGSETYAWARDAQRNSLNAYSSASGCKYGSFRNTLSGNCLTGYGWTENESRATAAAGEIDGLLTAVQGVDHTRVGLYYMYATTKGMRAFTPEIRYMPNGRDWNREFTDFLIPHSAADGSFDWDPSYTNRAGIDARTALSTQIIQTWLESIAYPRAFPELASPGTEITFDHSWSYVLDPAVTIEEYRWNVVDYPQGLDVNGDGDFNDPGDVRPEDTNGNGVVDANEIGWDFVTDDPARQFFYTYDDDLDWGEVKRHNVVLAVVDSNGRIVTDTDAVEIKLSLLNHAPTIIAHPDGRQARYRGYIGTEVILDARETYDVDAEHEVYPGDAQGRPAGRRDAITSLHYDLNFDGDFDDAGEDGLNQQVRLTLRDGMAVGDLVALPIRACDDGQWNGECYEADDFPNAPADYRKASCSECAYGSAAIEIIRNVEPPVIDLGNNPYTADFANPIVFDLSGSRDPEGVLGLKFTYEIIRGSGTLGRTPGYDADDDWGPKPTYAADPDGTRVDEIRVTVTDHGGLSTVGVIQINVPNVAPEIAGVELSYTPRAPAVNPMQIESIGDGWYRVTVVARRAESWDVSATIDASDVGGDVLTHTVDFDGNGQVDAQGAAGQDTVGPFVYQAGGRYTLVARTSDGEGADSFDMDVQVPVNDATLQYFLDVGNDGQFEVSASGVGRYTFQVAPGTDAVQISGFVRDSNGAQTAFGQNVELANGAPVVEVAQLLSQTGFNVVITASASDPDGDTLTYTVDWGDGSEPTTIRGGIGAHSFPENVYRTYTIRVTIDDGRGGRTVREIRVEFEAPPENRAPIIEDVRVIKQGGFDTLIVVGAQDPDGDVLTYTYRFGDDSAPESNRGGIISHRYAAERFQAYTITVTVTDGREGSAQQQVVVDFPPPIENNPPVVNEIELDSGPRGQITLTVNAWDPEGDRLSYRIHWGDEALGEGGEDETRNLPGGFGTHRYDFDPEQRLREGYVLVTDTEGNVTREDIQIPVEDNQTVIRDFSVNVIRDGTVLINVVADDRDGGELLVYSFDFENDGELDVNNQPGNSIVHSYAEAGDYVIRVKITDTWSGNVIQEGLELTLDPWIGENGAPVIGDVQITHNGGGVVTVAIDSWDPEGGRLTVEIHWGDEDDAMATERLIGGMGSHAYGPNDAGSYTGWIEVTDDAGSTTRQQIEFEIGDSQTVINQFSATLIGEGTYLIAVQAEDADGIEGLVYSYDFNGDGTYELTDVPVSSTVYTYAEPGQYTIRVRVTDSWSGQSVTAEIQVDLQPWVADNQPPIIHSIQVVVGQAGNTELLVDASDPEGGRLTVVVHWGDEDDAEAMLPLLGMGGSHQYPYALGIEFDGRLLVTDAQGARVEGEFTVEVVDSPTRIREVSLDLVRDGIVLITVQATDIDGAANLTYDFDFDNDGVWDLVNQLANSTVHTFDAGGSKTVRVRVTDTWSGVSAQAEGSIELDVWERENQAPTVHDVSVTVGTHGVVDVVVDASDPEGGRLDFVIHWGDEMLGDSTMPLAAGVGTHEYAYPEQGVGYTAYVIVTDEGGLEARFDFEVVIVDAPTVIRDINVSWVRDGLVLIEVIAEDPDGREALRYSFDFGAVGDEITDQVSSSTVYNFDGPGSYTITVQVRDAWSGGTATGEVEVEIDDWIEPNQPPRIYDVTVVQGPRGQAALTVEADDPEGERLLVEVHWGDEDEGELVEIANMSGEHWYDLPDDGAAYGAYVVATDPRGASTRFDLEIVITDRPTIIDSLSLSQVFEGQVRVHVVARDEDSASLQYAFDFDDDGVADIEAQADNSALWTFDRAGEHTVMVMVTDPWSGQTTRQSNSFKLDAWETAVNLGGDHLEGDEGQCLVFRIGDGGALDTKVDPSVCGREENPDSALWNWDFGDGFGAKGSEVGHIFADDGIYEIAVTGGTVDRPLRSTIQVLVINMAPTILSQPPVIATRGREYRYTLYLEDPGPTDALQVELRFAPDGMIIAQGSSDREWVVSWPVPGNYPGDQVEIELKVTDGRMVDGEWVPDGGEAVQLYNVTVQGQLEGDALSPGDGIGGITGAGADGGVDPGLNADAFTGSSCNCDLTGDSPSGFAFVLLGLFGLLGLRRRRR